ncbi:MAG: N-formylglutamate amidohydrolase [Rhodospirillales bacterium]|nr:N-formylglutamate amidohydrolase [Rhodospirillales bacterium]
MSDMRREDDPLLGPDDPPPYEIVNPRGTLPVVLLCDHASNAVPEALDNLGLAASELERHIAWDIGAAEITRRMAAHFDAPAVLSGYSRLVIDCNRQLDDEQSIVTVSDGTEIPANIDMSPAEGADRTEACFWPYHEAAAAVIEGVEARGVVPPVVMIHSFTPVMGCRLRPWHIGILWERDGRIALPLMDHLRARGDLCVGDNEPYTASSPHGYTMPVHAARHGRANVQIEIRQDLIGNEAGIAAWTDIMIEGFTSIFAGEDIYRREI